MGAHQPINQQIGAGAELGPAVAQLYTAIKNLDNDNDSTGIDDEAAFKELINGETEGQAIKDTANAVATATTGLTKEQALKLFPTLLLLRPFQTWYVCVV